ncbi:hypothetical protein A0J61_11169 [Choanephora cucurbitarum]|uniref:Uncharacterized protein n=1 Tax=Choanephora cucurbitarum TaxID=101091 RepID=A0A1C7MVB9_9FUNG|nr:hypothetical protein A0J61_11169 [Choanephora cucurbitarum]
MYPVDEPNCKTCPNEECGQARYCNEAEIQAAIKDVDRDNDMPLPELIPTRQMAYSSLDSALTEIYVDEDCSEILIEGPSLTEVQKRVVSHYRDVFSGSVYKQLLVSGKIKAKTICVIVFVDGYRLKNMQKAHQVMINCLILNVHPEHRTKEENMIQIGVVLGKPYDLNSYLGPLIEEVNDMYSRGIVIQKDDLEKYRGNVAIVGITGDIPGISKLMVFGGHTSTFGCSVCLAEDYSPVPVSSHGKYFPDLDPIRRAESLINGDPNYSMHGLPDDYANLPTFTGSFFFFGDELHMLGHGIGHLIYKLIHPSTFDFYRALNSSSYTFDFIDGFSRK